MNDERKPERPQVAYGQTGLVVEILRQRLGGRVQTGEAIRTQHANSVTWIAPQPPEAVVFVESEDEVLEVVRICHKHHVPIVAFGGGTSLEGQVNAPHGGISLDFSAMNRIVRVSADDLHAVVQPGVTRKQLNEHLRDMGLFFPVDPGAETATLGGMAATRASGTTTVRYGTMRDNVLSLRAVTADGTLIRTASNARKSSSGYDLTRLMVGSEGTLAIFTELTVRLYGIPEAILAAVAPFETLDGACRAVIQAIQLGLGVARIELLDPVQIRACNAYSGLSFDERPTLFLEFHGTEAGTRETVATFRALAEAEGVRDFQWAATTEERNRLWKARHDAYFAARALRPGAAAIATDVCVPISRLAECVTHTVADIEEHAITAPIVGHAGDGNFHTVVLVDMDDPADIARCKGFVHRLSERAIAMDGTCTGEHGVGTGKIALAAAEHGPAIDVMRRIKAALDPLAILNPAKML
ncbi:MAG: FAD-binding protein [Rhizobiales bacterium]|nr:FAD-binding protein [Hyphomicrobiales bacterium]